MYTVYSYYSNCTCASLRKAKLEEIVLGIECIRFKHARGRKIRVEKVLTSVHLVSGVYITFLIFFSILFSFVFFVFFIIQK